MPNSYARQGRSETIVAYGLVAFLSVLFLFGGASRADSYAQFAVRLAAIVAGATALIFWARIPHVLERAPLRFWLLMTTIVAIQLIPLPKAIWSSLPGHSLYAEIAKAAGLSEIWRPLSLTPDLTLNTLLSLLPGLAVILLAMRTPTRYWNKILIAILICAFVSAALGILQVAAGADSGIYLYQVTNRGSAVGLFANRNHQALLLAISFPCLALWAVTPPRQSRTVTIRNWFALLGSFSLLLVVLIVGSRAGLILAALGAASALILIRTSGYRLSFGSSRLTRITMYSVLAFLGLVLGSIALFSSRSETVERLGRGLFLEDQRITATPIVLRIWTDFFPTGAGFGSFDPVFRTYEPVSMLGPQYFNHAHNDLLEVGLEGGLPAYIVLALILGWTAWKSFKVWRERQPTRPILYGRLASIVIVLMLIASLVDYPLRTPVMSGLFALMLGWLAFDRSQAARLRTATAGKGP